MKFMVGLQQLNDSFLEYILKNREHVYEVYFSWADFANGRGNSLERDGYTSWELQKWQNEALKKLSDAGLLLNLLLNGNCYGKDSQSRKFFDKIGNAVAYIQETYGLHSVTTTSPLIAKFLHANFEGLEVRASVNMEIGTIQGMAYLKEYFDSYYIQRERNRDFDALNRLNQWCRENGKQMFLLANSGCLNHCSAHHFHDNLVAHESEISAMDNAYEFTGICHEFLKDEKNYEALIHDTSFIRPEDIHLYESYVPAVKLATRVHKRPENVLQSYIRASYSGDILALLEPAHSIYPYVLENGNPLKLVKLTETLLGE